MSADVDVFEGFLDAGKMTYWLVGQSGDQAAYLRFTGPFQGGTVVWDCHFTTLAEVQATRNFIEIGEPRTKGVPLRVALDIACIDRPAIEKLIVMIRNYKRLRIGRHEYG